MPDDDAGSDGDVGDLLARQYPGSRSDGPDDGRNHAFGSSSRHH